MTRARCVRTDAVRSVAVAALLTAMTSAGCAVPQHEPPGLPPAPGNIARVATLRVGLPAAGRASLLFACDASPGAPRIGSATYVADSLDASRHRWLRADQTASDSAGMLAPDTLVVRACAEATDEEIAFERGELDAAVFWPGELSARFHDPERGVRSRGALAVDSQGKILGMRFDMLADLGAYLAPTGPFINTIGIVNCLSGVYDVPAAYARIRLALTNTAPMAAYRGAGRPIMSYALERLVEHAAQQLGMDAAEFRRRNFIRKFPYKIAAGFEYDSGDFEGVMNKALAAADWRGYAARKAESQRRGKLRGRGMSTYIEATGAGFAPQDQIELRWGGEGELTIYAPTHNHGQGHETTYAQLVSGVLSIPMEKVRLRTAGPEFYLTGNATGGSRSLLAVGGVIYLGAQELVKKGLALAADELEAAQADIEFTAGEYRIKGTDRRISIQQLAAKHPGAMDLAYANKFGACFPNGCHIAEVEIAPETGEAQIVSYVACDDAGNIINHQIVEGQVQGGIAQGAGQAFTELAVYDEAGQLLTGSFMDYAMPRPGEVAGLKLLEHPVPTKLNPLGAKGVGEAGVTGSLPALMNAVVDALRQAGVAHFEMPATPRRLWEALQAAHRKAA